MLQEVFSGHVAEGRTPVAFVVGIGAEVGEELRVVLVVHAPGVGVVDERVGGLRGSDAAHSSRVLVVVGAAHESLDEATAVIVEGAGLAVDGVDEGHLANVVHLGHVAGAEVRLAPALVVAVVAVLEQHAAAVDGLHDLGTRAAGPAAEFGRRGGDVARTVGTEVVDDHIGVLVARPAVARRAAIDGIDAHGVLALVAPIAAHHFGANLEPALRLPAQGGDGVVVGGRVHIGVGVFVFKLLAHHHLGFVGVGGHEAAEGHLRQQVAIDVGIAVVGDAVAVVGGVPGVFGGNARAHVGVVVGKEQYGRRRDVPSVIGVVEIGLHHVGGGAAHVGEALHLGEDALLDAVVAQLVGIGAEALVVGDDDEVFAAGGTCGHPLLHTRLVVHFGQLVVVGQVLHEDGVPVGRAEAGVAKLAVAAVEAHAELEVVVNAQLLGDGVVLVGHHGDGHGLHAAQAERLADGDGLFGEEGVGVVDARVFLVGVGRVVGVELDGCCGHQVDVADGGHAAVAHLDVGGGTIGHGHESAEGGQVGFARVGRQADAGAALDDVARIAVVGDADDAHLLQGMAHLEARAGVLFNGEPFSWGRVGEVEVSRLGDGGHGPGHQGGYEGNA